MTTPTHLTAADREFFGLVARASFANPFGDVRTELDRQIADLTGVTEREAQVDAVAHRVFAKIKELDERGAADLNRHTGDDRMALAIAFLFEGFHRWIGPFDDLILKQIAAGDTSLDVPFGREAIATLCRRGFPTDRAERYFATFYQLRRAYYLIDRGLTGASPCMRKLRERLWSNVFTADMQLYVMQLWNRMEDFSTLLLGATGTGKGAAAAALGRAGFIPFDTRKGCFAESFTRGFVALNLSQFPATLIESELFGHRKGAFTGAVEEHAGIFARCSPHGAIFLDEIGEVAEPLQIKLLQILQERTFTPVGSHERQRFAGRVIAATNCSLDELRRDGKFRDDFYYRLCSDVILVPTLQQRLTERPQELELLLKELVSRLTGQSDGELAAQIAKVLRQSPGPDYAWPGNVRELEQAVRRVLLTGHYAAQALPDAVGAHARFLAAIESGALTGDEVLAGYCARLYAQLGSYEEVARRTQLDRRTVRRYILLHRDQA
jgi:DNA-binding NtrC family response regulator